MKKKWILRLVGFFIGMLIVYFIFNLFLVGEVSSDLILFDLECDALNANEVCPEGYTCIKFPEIEKPVCGEENPCDYYCKSGDCRVAESFPLQIFCD